MTERLYYNDSSLLEFDANVTDTRDGGMRVVLDRTAFYPTSGGQPFDTGTLNGVRVVDVIDEEEAIVHVVEQPLDAKHVHGVVDRERRLDHRQQHSGQHLLSAAFEELFGIKTVSFHLGSDASTIDLAAPELTYDQIVQTERRANQLVAENRTIGVTIEDAAQADGLRKPSERSGPLRIVSIDGYDRSACGGTHVSTTGEIGCVLLRKLDKIRGSVRLEFLCGLRAVEQSRAEYDALSRIARHFSAAPADTPALVGALIEQAKESDKQRRKIAIELAERVGREMYAATEADARGVHRRIEETVAGALSDEVRTRAQAFTGQPKAIFVASGKDPACVLLACSSDLGLHAGNLLKQALQTVGGRGGGSALLAQGSLPSHEALAALLAELVHL